MIDFQEARALIERHARVLSAHRVLLKEALGSVSAGDIVSPVSLPSFDNSAMDGFVLSSIYTKNATPDCPVLFEITGEIKAGDRPGLLKGPEAKRIMTGSPIPNGADTVLLKEQAIVTDGRLSVGEPLTAGRHVRRTGEELKKGETALAGRSLIHPGVIGFLASMGLERVRVFRKPRVALIATGSELTVPGRRLEAGKIYDSNTSMLEASLQDMGIRPVSSHRVADRPEELRGALRSALAAADIIILTGGVSVGEHDHVKQAAAQTGVRAVFWKIRQKPGKPLFFGTRGRKMVFGLPGNPASVFTCFYEYVYPAIRLLMGHSQPYLIESQASLQESVKPDLDKILFLKGRTSAGGQSALPLTKQHSHMLSSLCDANAFLVIPGSSKPFEEGASVLVHTLPYAV